LDAGDIRKALEHYHLGPEWILLFELRIGTGYNDPIGYMDAFALNTYPSKGIVRVCYEIKVSRSDYLVEIKKPKKRRYGLLYSNEFYFIAPKGMLKSEEIPIECGLREVREDGQINTALKAPNRDTPPASWRFVASIARNAMKRSI
jgi:hypothetical protein